MPRYSLSPQDRRVLQQQQGGGNDTQDTTALLQQLAQIYNLQQEQQLAPEKLYALQSENQARDYANTQAPVEGAARARLANAQANHFENEPNPGQLSMHDVLAFHEMSGGKPLPPELMSAAPPEYQHFWQQKAADDEAKNAALRAQFESTGAPQTSSPSTMPFGNRQGGVIQKLFQGFTPEAQQANDAKFIAKQGPLTPMQEHPLDTAWNYLFGTPLPRPANPQTLVTTQPQ